MARSHTTQAIEATLTRFLATRCEGSAKQRDETASGLSSTLVLYCEFTLRRFGCNLNALVGALCLVDRLQARSSRHELLSSVKAAHQTLLACFCLAMKGMEDTHFKLSYLAQSLRIDQGALAQVERLVLLELNYTVLVGHEEFQAFAAKLAQVRTSRSRSRHPTRPVTVAEAADSLAKTTRSVSPAPGKISTIKKALTSRIPRRILPSRDAAVSRGVSD